MAEHGTRISTQKELHEYLFSNLRINSADLANLNPERIVEFAERYRSRRVKLLSDVIIRLKKGA